MTASSSNHVPAFVEAVSGSIGASAANVLVYPLDLVASRMQTKTPQQKNLKTSSKKDTYADLPTALRTIYAGDEGILGFYQGIASDTLSTALSNFLYFYIYAALSTLVAARLRKIHDKPNHGAMAEAAVQFSAGKELVIGSLAGIISRGFTTPLSTITVRKQTASKVASKDQEKHVEAVEDEEEHDSHYSQDSSMMIARDIYEEHGLKGFWRGYSSACALTINPAITFFLIAAFKRAFLPRRFRDKPTQTQTFFISATASALASTVCYPLILAKTRLQWKSPSGKMMYRGMSDVFTKTVKKGGVGGLYVGLQTQIIKGFFSQGVTMVLKQRTELLVIHLYRLLYQYRKTL